MKTLDYIEKKAAKSQSYVAQQTAVLNEQIRQRDKMIRNLRTTISERNREIAKLNQNIDALLLKIPKPQVQI